MCRTYQKLISLVVVISFSVLLLVEKGYAAAPTVKLVISPDTTEVSVGAEPIAIATQASGSNLAYTWELLGPGSIEGEGPAVFYHVPDTLEKDSARAIITVTVIDGEGQQTTETAIFTIRARSTQEQPAASASKVNIDLSDLSQGEPPADEPESKGMSKRTKIIIGGVATAAAIGGGIALLMGGDDEKRDEKSGPFTGTFRGEFVGQTDSGETTYDTVTFTLTQSGNAITGTLNISSNLPGWCTVDLTTSVTGTATGTSAVLNIGSGQASCQSPEGGTYTVSLTGSTMNVSLINNNNTLRLESGTELPRIAKVTSAESGDRVEYRFLYLEGDFVRQ